MPTSGGDGSSVRCILAPAEQEAATRLPAPSQTPCAEKCMPCLRIDVRRAFLVVRFGVNEARVFVIGRHRCVPVHSLGRRQTSARRDCKGWAAVYDQNWSDSGRVNWEPIARSPPGIFPASGQDFRSGNSHSTAVGGRRKNCRSPWASHKTRRRRKVYFAAVRCAG